MFFKGKHEAARMELRFINKTGNRHFDKPSDACIDFHKLVVEGVVLMIG